MTNKKTIKVFIHTFLKPAYNIFKSLGVLTGQKKICRKRKNMANLVDIRNSVLYSKSVIQTSVNRTKFCTNIVRGGYKKFILKGKENYEKTEKRLYAC